MVRPSNPKLMARVLDAVTHLGEGKGSLTRDVLEFVKQNSAGPKRNLTMQVRRALKHAVNAGLLRCKSGRYKMQLALNPISHHQHNRHEDPEIHKNAEKLEKTNEEPPIGGTDPSRRVHDRQRKASRKKRAPRKSRKRSATRSGKKKVARRRTATMERRARKLNGRTRRKNNKNATEEDWPTRRRRMMSQSRFYDDEVEDDEEEEEDQAEEEEEEEEDEEGEEDPRDTRDAPKMKSVNEDSASNMSGDSNSVGRHRSRRSKHLVTDNKSPSRRGNGDGETRKKSTRRSTSRRRSQQRQRENRRESAPEEAEEQPEGMDEEPDNEAMDLDEDQGDVERVDTPPKNQDLE